jgi:hypothetical protein
VSSCLLLSFLLCFFVLAFLLSVCWFALFETILCFSICSFVQLFVLPLHHFSVCSFVQLFVLPLHLCSICSFVQLFVLPLRYFSICSFVQLFVLPQHLAKVSFWELCHLLKDMENTIVCLSRYDLTYRAALEHEKVTLQYNTNSVLQSLPYKLPLHVIQCVELEPNEEKHQVRYKNKTKILM